MRRSGQSRRCVGLSGPVPSDSPPVLPTPRGEAGDEPSLGALEPRSGGLEQSDQLPKIRRVAVGRAIRGQPDEASPASAASRMRSDPVGAGVETTAGLALADQRAGIGQQDEVAARLAESRPPLGVAGGHRQPAALGIAEGDPDPAEDDHPPGPQPAGRAVRRACPGRRPSIPARRARPPARAPPRRRPRGERSTPRSARRPAVAGPGPP